MARQGRSRLLLLFVVFVNLVCDDIIPCAQSAVNHQKA